MRNVLSSASLALLSFALGCTTPQASVSSSDSTSLEGSRSSVASFEPSLVEAHLFAESSNHFAFDLYHQVAGEQGNVAFSPASISFALAMTWAGAKGETADEMQRVLHFEGAPERVAQIAGGFSASLQDPSNPVVLRMADRLFGDGSVRFEQPFLDLTKSTFDAPLESLDFVGAPEASRKRINEWVATSTEKRIQDLVPEGGVDANTRLVLVDAIYFNGDWEQPFDSRATHDAPFFTPDGEKPAVPTMHEAKQLPFASKNGLKALALPYRGGKTSMLILLPEKADGLPALEKCMTAAELDRIVQTLVPTDVTVSLPRFDVAPPSAIRLGETLARMGMPSAFDARRADFTGITNPPDANDRVHIGEVFHKAFVTLDEKGTEAAAGTAVAMPKGAKPLEGEAFNADHPFLFFVRDDTSGAILFMGRVDDPSAH
jgi:serpin B